MRVYRRLSGWAMVFSISLVPVQMCHAARDWAAYVFDGTFEAGEHLDISDFASDGTLTLDGIDPSPFIATASTLTFIADGAVLAADPASITVVRNGVGLPADHVHLAPQSIALIGALLPGLNHLVVLAQDVDGYALNAEVRLWAGSNSLLVDVRDENNNPVSSIPVRLELADAPEISMTAITVNGTASFTNLPPTTVSLRSQGDGNTFDVLSTTGDVGSAVLKLEGFRPASIIDNNDFSLGLQGWETGTAPVNLIAHEEKSGGPSQSQRKAKRTRTIQPRAVQERRKDARHEAPIFAALIEKSASKGSNMDLLLTTGGIGPQAVSRTFDVAPGAGRIKIRYRFITSEAPAGYFGSQYNDNYSIVIRTLDGGLHRIASNSMNRLGIDAFDAGGATPWYDVTLPIHGDGLDKAKAGSETVQVDVTVTNIGDDDFDSAVVIDYIEREPLSISSDLSIACPNQTVTFQVDGAPAGTITWTGGGTPAEGTGAQFTTRFSQPGQMTVQAEQNDGGTIQKADASVTVWDTSGVAWTTQFPNSESTSDLAQPFRDNANYFISALRTGNATVNVGSTLRPPERAHLMHYSYRISQQGLDPEAVPEYPGVNICWAHRDVNGNVDMPASTGAARALANAYRILVLPVLTSRHIQGMAVDMNITWAGNLAIQAAGGAAQTITTVPRTGEGNVPLRAIGAGYGVIKLVRDPPHWSDNGN